MSWENKILRIVRVVNSQEIGTFGRLLTAITAAGGNVGNIELLNETTSQIVRDIAVYADDEQNLEHILEAIRGNQGTRLLDVRDEVMALHLKGKIAVRSRYAIDSMATLRRVYTPVSPRFASRLPPTPSLPIPTPPPATWSPSSLMALPSWAWGISARWRACR